MPIDGAETTQKAFTKPGVEITLKALSKSKTQRSNEHLFAIQPFGAGVGAEITLKALSKFKSRRSNEHFLCNTAFRGWRRCRDHPKSAPFESENRFQHPLRFFSLFAFFTFLCYCPRESLGVCTTSSLIYRSYRLPLLERQISRRQR